MGRYKVFSPFCPHQHISSTNTGFFRLTTHSSLYLSIIINIITPLLSSPTFFLTNLIYSIHSQWYGILHSIHSPIIFFLCLVYCLLAIHNPKLCMCFFVLFLSSYVDLVTYLLTLFFKARLHNDRLNNNTNNRYRQLLSFPKCTKLKLSIYFKNSLQVLSLTYRLVCEMDFQWASGGLRCRFSLFSSLSLELPVQIYCITTHVHNLKNIVPYI